MLLTGLISHCFFFFLSLLLYSLSVEPYHVVTTNKYCIVGRYSPSPSCALLLVYYALESYKKKRMHCIILMFYIQYVDHFVISLLIEVGTKTDSMLKMIRYENMWKYVFSHIIYFHLCIHVKSRNVGNKFLSLRLLFWSYISKSELFT